MTRKSFRLETVVSLGAMVALWVVAALVVNDASTLPSPWQVVRIVWVEAAKGTLWVHLVPTVLRVVAAFSLAMGIGSVLGYALGRVAWLDRWADPWVVVLLNLPALVVIVLCYLWIGLTEVAAITAVSINKMATVTVTVREGARTLDPRLSDMAQIYRMPRSAQFSHVVLPQLAPYLSAAARNGVAIIWKLVLVVEFLGRSNGIGFQIHLYFQLWEIGHVLAYSITFVALMLAVEYLALQPWERSARRWRGQSG
ncbi:ABC transporter permease [Aliiroseovarius sp. PTFE2010]|uniref:ABC transporter permease n=1 Tax=Aliiroseovarius sp. PTFE2010 TaxID=3417190 RepID=UPI003CEE0645